MAQMERPSMSTRFCGLAAVILGSAMIYASFFASGFDVPFLITGGIFFGGPGLLGLIRGY